MKYYKAKQYIDDPQVYGGVIIEHELLTMNELKRYNMEKYINCFEVVDIKPKNTYYCFGARFEMEGENNGL